MLAANGWQIVLIVFLFLQTAAVTTRVYVKLRILKEFRAEDYVIILAWICSAATDVALIDLYYVTQGNKPILFLPAKTATHAALMTYACEAMYPIATWVAKIAVGLMLVRIFARIWQGKVTHVAMFLYTIITFCYFLYILFYCGNPTKWWVHNLEGKCPQLEIKSAGFILSMIHGIATMLVDLVFLVVPWTYIRHANMNKRTKMSVGAILSLGSMSIIITIARLPFLKQLYTVSALKFSEAFQTLSVLSALEVAICIICFSMTSCKPLFMSFYTKVATTVFNKSSTRSGQGNSGRSANDNGTRQTAAIANDDAVVVDIEKTATVVKDETVVRVSSDGSSSNYSPVGGDTIAHGAPAVIMSHEELSNEDDITEAGTQDILTALNSGPPPRRHSTIDWWKTSEGKEPAFDGPPTGRRQSTLSIHRARRGSADTFGPDHINTAASGRRQSTLSLHNHKARRGSTDTFGHDLTTLHSARRASAISMHHRSRRGSEDPAHPPGSARRQSTVSWYDKYDGTNSSHGDLSTVPTAAPTRRHSAVSWSSQGRRISWSSAGGGGGGGGRRFSRIRLGDLKFYGLFNKDVPPSPQISRVTSRDLAFYGIEHLDAPPPSGWFTAASPISDIEEGVESPLERSRTASAAASGEKTAAVVGTGEKQRPRLESLTTEGLGGPSSAGTLGVPVLTAREPVSASSSKYSPVSPLGGTERS